MIAGGHAGFVGDFTLANAIPSSYLTAGRITFEDKSGSTTTAGTIYWSLSWGGASYLGSNAGSSVNDADSNFGPAFASALPSGSAKGVALSIAAGTKSSSNANDYAFTGDPATVVKNDRTSFTVVPEPANAALLVLGAAALGAFAYGRRGRGGLIG